jgi:hypothetical protein
MHRYNEELTSLALAVRLGNLWNNSSVIKGMYGLRSIKPCSKHVYKTFLAVFISSELLL